MKISNKKSHNFDYQNQNNTNFTSLKDLNEKKQNQTSWDDSSLKSNLKLLKESSSGSFSRSQTVKCRPSKGSQRPKILIKDQFSPEKNKDNSNEDVKIYFLKFFFRSLLNKYL